MSLNQKGAVHIFLPLALLVSALIISANISTTKKYDPSVQGIYIAKSNTYSSNSNKPNSTGNSNQSLNQEGRSEETKTKQKEVKTTPEQTTTNTGNAKKSIEAEVEKKGNTLLIKANIKTAEEASSSTAQTLEDLRSISKFPLRIDTATNQLIMSKNGTERVLTVLPAKAVQNMLRAHLKKGLGPKFFSGATPSATPLASASATPSSTNSASPTPEASATASPSEEPIANNSANITVTAEQITLEEDGGQFVYKIPAKKNLKVFGIIPATTNLTGYVSAETGALLKEQESLLAKILGLLSQ